MNTNVIAENTVKLSNGFQRGQWVKFLALSVDGKWEIVGSRDTGECTWHDDEKVTDFEVKLEGKGLVGGFHGVSASSHQSVCEGFFGFTAEELASPSPENGYTVEDHGCHAHDWKDVETLADYLKARFVNKSFTLWSSMKDGVHDMPYNWGDQAAHSYALVIGGKLIDSVTGCGDNTPYLDATEEKCLAERKLFTTSDREDQARDQHEQNERNNAAFKLGWSDKWADVANHIRSSYKVGQNPLPGLRKKYPGQWVYSTEGWKRNDSEVGEVRFTELPQRENETAKAPEGSCQDFWGNVWSRWQVSYIPNKTL